MPPFGCCRRSAKSAVRSTTVSRCVPAKRRCPYHTDREENPEDTSRSAKSGHRKLESAPATGEFQRNQQHPLSGDLFLPDETLMVDVVPGHQVLRYVVIWQELSFSTQNAGGSRFVETLLTTVETCRQQGRDVFAWVTAAVQSRFAGERCQSLLHVVGTGISGGP